MHWSRSEETDPEIEGVEPFQSKSGLDSFGVKVACHFEGLDPSFDNSFVDPNLKSISQCDRRYELGDWLHNLSLYKYYNGHC
jgi:hypothetical protein